jgi:hypothetical protein
MSSTGRLCLWSKCLRAALAEEVLDLDHDAHELTDGDEASVI